MAEQSTPTDRDSIVAAILAAASFEPGQTPQYKVDQFKAVLKELCKRGGSAQLALDAWNETR